MILVNARSFKALQRPHWSFPGLTGNWFIIVACLSMHVSWNIKFESWDVAKEELYGFFRSFCWQKSCVFTSLNLASFQVVIWSMFNVPIAVVRCFWMVVFFFVLTSFSIKNYFFWIRESHCMFAERNIDMFLRPFNPINPQFPNWLLLWIHLGKFQTLARVICDFRRTS